MSTLRIAVNDDLEFKITTRESDVYSDKVYVKLERTDNGADVRRCDELFLTPEHLDRLGRFLIKQADEIKSAKEFRSSGTT